jgi:hypothetical protein
MKNVETGLRPVFTIILALIAMILLSCSGNHLINDSQYLATIEKAFNQRKQLATNRDSALFSVFNQQEAVVVKNQHSLLPL